MSGPVFDHNTLFALTEKIQSDIKSGTDPRKKPKPGKKDTNARITDNSVPTKSSERSTHGTKRKRDAEQEAHETYSPSKRHINGNSSSDTKNPSSASRSSIHRKPEKERSTKQKKKQRNQLKFNVTNNSKSVLKVAVSDLGGDENDLKLVEDAGSVSELEGEDSGEQSTALRGDIQDMIKALGIPHVQPVDEDTSEEETGSTAEADEVSLTEDEQDGESDLDDDIAEEPKLIKQVEQSLEKPPERKKPNPNGLLVDPQSEWHSIPIPGISVAEEGGSQLHPETLKKLQDYAKELLETENKAYAASQRLSGSAKQFYASIMSSGTLSDKISALTLSAQESPIHNIQALESLLNLAKKRNRSQAVEVLSALKDLLGPGNLLPSNRRLKAFTAQSALNFVNGRDAKSWFAPKPLPQPLTKIHLLLWAFEDWLKSMYFEILKLFEVWINDEIVYTRGKTLDFVFELLRDKPEQEANLLRLLVNKLGDTDKQIASKASYRLLQVENSHPAMKSLIISSIEGDLIFKRHQSNHAKYYGIVTLNQTILSSREEGVARQLLDIYFALFLEIFKKPRDNEGSKGKEGIPKINSKGDTQGGGSTRGKKANKKAAALAKSAAAEDELREKMLSAVLTGVNRAMPYVDKTSEFFDKHLDTLFRVTHSANFNTSIQALMLIQQLSGAHQAASNRFYRTLYESLLDPRLLHSSKQALYLNLLYRALRSDLSIKRVEAFIKRLLQITAMQQPSFVCAVMYLVRELETVFPSLTAFIDQTEDNESDEEVFNDVPEDSDGESQRHNANNFRADGLLKRQLYDGRKRDPEHANANKSCLWELAPMQQHFHPSVSLFASSLSEHEKMPSKPDLGVNTLIHFLDRFVYRNPKKTETGLRGHSLMQPLAGSSDKSGLLVTSKDRKSARGLPVNTEGFRNKKGDSIGADEVFFHRYFNEINKRSDKSKRVKEGKKKSARENVSSGEEDEDEIWQALVDSRPEIEGEDAEEEGWDDMDNFEEAMDEKEGTDAEEAVDEDHESEDDENDTFGLDDEDDLLASDDELPDGILSAEDGPNEEDGKEDEKSRLTEKKAKKNGRRKMLKSLPMFASAEDYAAMLEGEDEG